MNRPLEGCRVLVTRERPGELAAKLTARGANVIHVPLIAAAEPSDGGVALREALARLTTFDWLVVTSPAGAERVAAAAAVTPGTRIATVGTATAGVLERHIGRPIDLVAPVQRAESLAAVFVERVPAAQRVLVAQSDIAAPTLVDALRRGGHDVTVVTAYRTIALDADPAVIADADAVVFASGSAVEGWWHAFGTATPSVVVGIGPTTAAAADRFGLKMSAVAADHSLDGLVTELERVLTDSGAPVQGPSPRPE